MEATSFTKLLEPVKIGAMELRNRIVMPPMCTNFASETGAVTQRLIDYYVERARGGVGLVTVEATCVDSPVGRLSPLQLCVDDDKFIGGLNDLVEAIQEKGAKISLQLHHAGRQTTLAVTGGAQPVSASETVYKDVKARALPAEGIECVVGRFGESAKRAKAAGFDAVEIHGAHGYLIAQFLSPYVNKRIDEYGGDPEKRMRFVLEVLEETRKRVGLDFPIIFRLSGEEFVEDGLTLKEAKGIAQRLERAGVDALHVTAGVGGTIWPVQPMAVPRGCLVHLAEGIKEVVGIPVIAVGRINNPTLAEEILRDGRADLVSMGRALIADPELPRKVAEGRLDDIRMCTACLRGCSERFNAYLRISCTVNPAVGREKEYMVKPADKPKKVLVVGGGAAGLEAARVAALRGHEVTLYEKEATV